jgi:peptide/nickel transport system permease protein
MLIFFGMRLLPGDPILIWYSTSEVSQFSAEQIQQIRHEFGLDKPLVEQYINWLNGAIHGDLGKSLRYHTSVLDEIMRRLPITLYIGGIAFFLGFIIGIPAGVICAVRRVGGWIILLIVSNLGITVPAFWLGILLVYIFSLKLGWLPSYGYTSPFEDFWLSIRKIIMPVICLAAFDVAAIARQTRSSMLEVMRQDYIRTAFSKGLKERLVITRHAVKNGLMPIVTFTGLGASGIIGGAVLIETVFAIPGMGRMAVSSMLQHDYSTTQGITLIIAVGIVLLNLLVDISYTWIDPRIRYK